MINIAVIVEPRLHKYLKPVIDNMLDHSNLPIMVFHSNINEEFLKNNYHNNSRIKLHKLKLKNNNLTIPEYNILLTSKSFWNSIDGEYILIFQTDACLCKHLDTVDMTIYKDYGFVGAPNRPIDDKYNTWRNGGFSLRRKSLTLKCLNNVKDIITINEDKFYTVICKDIIKVAPYDISLNFSIEKYYNNNSIGLHKTWIYITKEQWQELKNTYPHISLIFNF